MPTYNYRCEECCKEYQVFQSIMENPISICKYCKGKLERLIKGSSVGLIFKGSGFYLTDYKNNTPDKDQQKHEKVNKQNNVSGNETKGNRKHS